MSCFVVASIDTLYLKCFVCNLKGFDILKKGTYDETYNVDSKLKDAPRNLKISYINVQCLSLFIYSWVYNLF